MADDDFDAVLDKHFARTGTWSLFTAICLLHNIDPAKRSKPIRDDQSTDALDAGY